MPLVDACAARDGGRFETRAAVVRLDAADRDLHRLFVLEGRLPDNGGEVGFRSVQRRHEKFVGEFRSSRGRPEPVRAGQVQNLHLETPARGQVPAGRRHADHDTGRVQVEMRLPATAVVGKEAAAHLGECDHLEAQNLEGVMPRGIVPVDPLKGRGEAGGQRIENALAAGGARLLYGEMLDLVTVGSSEQVAALIQM